jgi:hypothetical protein
MTPQLNQTGWLALSPEVRTKICKIFEIPKSGATIIVGGTNARVQSDGHLDKDLALITKEKMEKFLGLAVSTIDYFQLFDMVVAQLDKPEPMKPKIVELEENIAEGWKKNLQQIKDYSEEINLALKLKHIVWDMFPKQNEKSIQTQTVEGTKKRGRPSLGHN